MVTVATVASGCANSSRADDTSAAPRSTTSAAVITTTNAPTREAALAVIGDACQRFFEEDAHLDRSDTPEAIAEFVRARRAMLSDTIDVVDSINLPPDLAELQPKVRQLLAGALAIYESPDAADTTDGRTQAEDLIRQAAVTVFAAGAGGCTPPARSEGPAPTADDAGPLLPLQPVATIVMGPAGVDDNRIVADETSVWVGLRNIHQLVRIDPATNEVVARVDLGGSPSGLPTLIDGYAWVDTPTEIIRIDPATNAIDRRFPRSGLGSGGTNIVAFTRDEIYTCTQGTLNVMDPRNGSMIRQVPTGVPCYWVSAIDGEVWVSLTNGGPVSRVDPATGRVITTVDWPGGQFKAFDDGTLRWLITEDQIVAFDGSTGAVLGSATRSGIDTLQASAGGRSFWFTAAPEQRAIRASPVDGTVRLEEIAAGYGANAVAYHDGTVWVANSDAGTVMRFDVSPLGG